MQQVRRIVGTIQNPPSGPGRSRQTRVPKAASRPARPLRRNAGGTGDAADAAATTDDFRDGKQHGKRDPGDRKKAVPTPKRTKTQRPNSGSPTANGGVIKRTAEKKRYNVMAHHRDNQTRNEPDGRGLHAPRPETHPRRNHAVRTQRHPDRPPTTETSETIERWKGQTACPGESTKN